jgi:putative ABC transport system permease protein
MVILSNDLWKRRYGSDPDIIGKRIDLGFGGAEVVGVLAPGFRLLWPPGTGVDADADVYSAARFNFATASRINVSLRVIGRMKPGVPLAAVNEQLERIAEGLREQFPIKKTAGVHIAAQHMHDDLVADVRPAIMTLLGAVAFVLLIACANVANLLLVRTAARERELAVRAALGGSRWRIALPLLAEVAILAISGATLGLLLAQGGMSLLISLAPPNLPRLADVRLDTVVLAFTIATTFVAALIFGVLPALRSTRPNLTDALRSGRSASGVSGKRLRHTVVVAEVAMAFVLLVGGGLLMRSFMELQRAEPGFDASNMLTFEASLQSPDPAAHVAFTQQLSDRLRALPGVEGVTAAGPLPLTGEVRNARWGTEAAAADPSTFQQADVRAILPGYFDVMRTRVIEGRVLNETDNTPDSKTILIDRVLAAKAFPNASAVGKRLLVRIRGNEPELLEVAGVVDHQRHETLAADGRETIYVTSGFLGFGAANRWAVRLACSTPATCDPTSITPLVRRAVSEINPRTPVSEVQTMEAYVEQSMASTRFALVLIAAFAIIAALLACVGLYGVLATTVRQRTTELGVRLALGASRASVFRLVVGEGLSLTAFGLAAGLAGAFAVTRVMQSMLVGIAPTDPLTFGSVALLFVVVAALACWFPARRAAALDPMNALRQD